jgi:hypothetical protein
MVAIAQRAYCCSWYSFDTARSGQRSAAQLAWWLAGSLSLEGRARTSTPRSRDPLCLNNTAWQGTARPGPASTHLELPRAAVGQR